MILTKGKEMILLLTYHVFNMYKVHQVQLIFAESHFRQKSMVHKRQQKLFLLSKLLPQKTKRYHTHHLTISMLMQMNIKGKH